MKDKITYLVIGLLIAFSIMLQINNPKNSNADNESAIELGNGTLNNLIIRGTLTVGEGNSKITLENRNGNSTVIIQSNDTTVTLQARPDEAIVHLTPRILAERINGIGLTASEKDYKISSNMLLIDSEGIKKIGTTDNIKADRNFFK